MEDIVFVVMFITVLFTVLGTLLGAPFLLAFYTTLENKPENHWFHVTEDLMKKYGRKKTLLYTASPVMLFMFTSALSIDDVIDKLIPNLIFLALAFVWFFYACGSDLFSGKKIYENPVFIGGILIILSVLSVAFPQYTWFFSIYAYPISFLWGQNIFRYRAVRLKVSSI